MSNPYHHKFSSSNPSSHSYTPKFSPYHSATSPLSSNSRMYNPYESTIPNPYDSPIPNPYDAPIPNPYDVVASSTATRPAETQSQKPKVTKFNVSGTTITFPTGVITSKVPYSKLADIAGGYLTTGEGDEEGVWIDANLEGFKILLEYLRYETIYVPESVPKAMVKRVFRDMGVDWPGGIGQISTTPPPAPEEVYSPEMLAALRDIERDLVSVEKRPPGQPPSRSGVQSPERSRTAGIKSSSSTALPSYEDSVFSTSTSYSTDTKNKYLYDEPEPQAIPSFHSVVTSSLDTQITDLLLSHITPQLEAQAKMGILRGSVVVVPPSKPSTYSNIYSNTYSTTNREKEEDEEIIGSVTSVLGENVSGSGWCKVLRLPSGVGTDGSSTTNGAVTMAFISQPEAIKEIRRRLVRALNTGPGGVYDDADELLEGLVSGEIGGREKSIPGAAEWPPRPPNQNTPGGGGGSGSLLTAIISEVSGLQLDIDEAKREVRGHYSGNNNYSDPFSQPQPSSSSSSSSTSRWWKRSSSSYTKTQNRPQSPQQIVVSGGYAIAPPPPPPPKPKPKPKKGSVFVDVCGEDIHVRKMSDLGLYETVTLKGVVVRIEVVA